MWSDDGHPQRGGRTVFVGAALILLAMISGAAGFFVWGGDAEIVRPPLTWLLYALSFFLAGAGVIAFIVGAALSFWREKS